MRDRARKFALSSLSRYDSSKKALYEKLIARGFDKESAADAVDYVVSFGYIDEKRQIEKISLDLYNRQNFGKRKIFSRLVNKGYSPSDVSSVISSLVRDGEIDFEIAKERLLCKYPSELSPDEKRKILFKNGF